MDSSRSGLSLQSSPKAIALYSEFKGLFSLNPVIFKEAVHAKNTKYHAIARATKISRDRLAHAASQVPTGGLKIDEIARVAEFLGVQADDLIGRPFPAQRFSSYRDLILNQLHCDEIEDLVVAATDTAGLLQLLEHGIEAPPTTPDIVLTKANIGKITLTTIDPEFARILVTRGSLEPTFVDTLEANLKRFQHVLQLRPDGTLRKIEVERRRWPALPESWGLALAHVVFCGTWTLKGPKLVDNLDVEATHRRNGLEYLRTVQRLRPSA